MAEDPEPFAGHANAGPGRSANVTPFQFLDAGLGLVDLPEFDAQLEPFGDRSVPSLSCLHVVEHVGLGRYGDPLDPQGSIKAMRELQRVRG